MSKDTKVTIELSPAVISVPPKVRYRVLYMAKHGGDVFSGMEFPTKEEAVTNFEQDILRTNPNISLVLVAVLKFELEEGE